MRSKIKSLLIVVSIISLFITSPANAAGQSSSRNQSNNGVACQNTQSAKAQSGNSRATTCIYVVTLNANGGTASQSSINYVIGSIGVNLPDASRDGYTFNGWFLSSSGGSPVSNPYRPYSSVTLYAQWTQNSIVNLTMVYLGEATNESTIGALGTGTGGVSSLSIYDPLGNYFDAVGTFEPGYPQNSTNTLPMVTAGPLRFAAGLYPCRIDLWVPTITPTPQEIWDGASHGTGIRIEGSSINAFGNWTTSYNYGDGGTLFWSTSAKCYVP